MLIATPAVSSGPIARAPINGLQIVAHQLPPTQRVPIVAFTTPVNGSPISRFSAIGGEANDKSGSGIRQVALTIQRRSDGLFWNGRTWIQTQFNIAAGLNGNAWLVTTALPDGSNLTEGSYLLKSMAYDNLNDVGTSSISRSPIARLAVESWR